MNIQNHHKKNRTRNLIIGVAVVLLLLTGSYLGFAYSQSIWPFKAKTSPESSNNNDSINYNPPTDQEVKEGQDAKQRLIDEKNNSQDPNKTASVGVAFAGVSGDNLEIRAFTPSVVEGGGTCTATLKKGSATVTKSSEAFIDSTSPQCRVIYIPLSEFPEKGAWNLIVSYKSSSASGTSGTVEVNI